MIGIYTIINQSNNDIYIGSAKNIFNRWSEHIKCLESNKHINKHLQNAWNRYTSDNFIFQVLELCALNDLIKKEQEWIDKESPNYNICKIAGSRLGTKHSEETKRKWSIKRKGSVPWNKGKKTGPLPEEWRKKVAEAGRKSLLKFNESCKGKHLTEEHKKKVGQALKGRQFSKEHRKKLSEATKKHFLLHSGACPI